MDTPMNWTRKVKDGSKCTINVKVPLSGGKLISLDRIHESIFCVIDNEACWAALDSKLGSLILENIDKTDRGDLLILDVVATKDKYIKILDYSMKYDYIGSNSSVYLKIHIKNLRTKNFGTYKFINNEDIKSKRAV